MKRWELESAYARERERNAELTRHVGELEAAIATLRAEVGPLKETVAELQKLAYRQAGRFRRDPSERRMPAFRRFRTSPQPTALIVFGLALAIRLLTLPAGNFVDEGEILLVARRMAEGQALYRDVFTHHFPLPYAAIATVFGLTGPSVLAARGALLVALMVVLGWLALKTRRPGVAGVAALALALLAAPSGANLITYPAFSALALLTVFVLTVEALSAAGPRDARSDGARARWIALAGSLACLIDPLAIYPLTAAAVALLVGRTVKWRAAAQALLVIAAVGAIAWGWGLARGNLDDFWRDAIVFNRDTYSRYQTSASPWRLGDLRHQLTSGLGLTDPRLTDAQPLRALPLMNTGDFDAWAFSGALYRLAMLALALLCLARGQWLRGAFVWLFAGALLAMNASGFRTLPLQACALWAGAEIFIWLAAGALSAGGLPAVTNGQGEAQAGPGALSRVRAVLGLGAICLGGSCVLMLTWLCLWSGYQTWLQRGALSLRASMGGFAAHAAARDALAADPATRFACLPDCPYVGFFSQMRPLSRYPMLLPWMAEAGDKQLAAALRGDRVLLELDVRSWTWQPEYRLWDRIPETRARMKGLVELAPDVYASADLARGKASVYSGKTDLVDQLNSPALDSVGEIIRGRVVRQELVAGCASLARIDIKLATFRRSNSARLDMVLRDLTTGAVVAERHVANWEVMDNAFIGLAFADQPESRGRRYALDLRSPDGRGGDALTARRRLDRDDLGGALWVGGEQMAGELDLAYGCYDYAPPLP